MDQTIIPVATALILTLGAFVSVVFARRSARGNASRRQTRLR